MQPLPSLVRRFLNPRLLLPLLAVATPAIAADDWTPGSGWTLAWSDEFEGTAVNSANWTFETGAGGWGNNELQTYTPMAAAVQNGELIITANRNADGSYTSARLKTQGKHAWKYGKIAARLKLPRGQGIWPAFWMLGSNITTVGWPKSGEIDIMEMIGGGEDRDDSFYGTLHWDANGHASTGTGRHELPDPQILADDYHVFEIEWNSLVIIWRRDGVEFGRSSIDVSQWPTMTEFHENFFILLNLAVGGNWPGNPDATTTWPQRLLVDWVRVYHPAATTSPTLASATVTAGHDVNLSAGNATGPFQWQASSNGTTWTNLTDGSAYSGTNTATLTVKSAPSGLNNTQYRFQAGGMASNAAALTVIPAFFPFPTGLAIDAAGVLVVTDANANTVQQVNPMNQVSLLAGSTGTAGSTDGSGTTARFNQPGGVVVLASGNLIVADTAGGILRTITAAGAVTTLAGTAGVRGGADGSGAAASFASPTGLAGDAGGNLYVADAMNHTIRRVTSTGTVSTFVGTTGASGIADGIGTTARFSLPSGVAIDGSGNVYVADTNNHTIRKITSTGAVTTLAGLPGISGFADGTGSAAQFNRPMGVRADAAGNLYVADTGNSVLRRVSPAGGVTILAGTPGVAGLEDGTGTQTLFNQPRDLVLDSAGNLYVADTGNAAIRKVTPTGVVTTLALSAAPVAPPPNPNPPTPPSPPPTPPSSGGGGGGGAPSLWFLAALIALGLLKSRRVSVTRRT